MRKGKKRILGILNGMKQRCYNPKSQRYNRYGGRGIKICDEWRNNPQAFVDWSMNNGYADNLSIDRINNDGDYEPGNCRWTTNKVQQNNKSTNILITYNGKTQDIKQWSEELGICYVTLFYRIKSGWPVEKAFTEPVDMMVRNTYPEVICGPGEKRNLKVKEYKRRQAGIRTWEQKIADDKAKVQAKADAIHEILRDNPNMSVRQVAKLTGVPKSTVQRLKSKLY